MLLMNRKSYLLISSIDILLIASFGYLYTIGSISLLILVIGTIPLVVLFAIHMMLILTNGSIRRKPSKVN